MNTLITRWIHRPVAVLAWSVAFILAGVWALFQIPLEWTPQVELPSFTITATWPGASSRAVERHVTAPIERAVVRVAGTASVESISNEGQSTVQVSVRKDVDIGVYAVQLGEQMDYLRDVLPKRVVPRIDRQIPEVLRDEVGFMTLQLVGPLPPMALRRLADERVRPLLQSIPGVGSVSTYGGRTQELLVRLDLDRIQTYGLQVEEARDRLLSVLRDRDFGVLRVGGDRWLLLQAAERSVAELRHLPLRVRDRLVRLSDIATLSIQPAPVRSISRIDGQPVVTLRIDRAPGSHMLSVAEAVHRRIEQIKGQLPQGVRLLVADDRSENVRKELDSLLWKGGLGILGVIGVLWLLLRRLQAVLVVLFSVAVAVSAAFLFMLPLGLTLNLLTIGGLVLVVGLLVDNAVVVVEQLQVQIPRWKGNYARAVEETLKAVWVPLLGGALTTIVVLGPLVYFSGELQALFTPFAVLVALVLSISLLTAVVVVPVTACVCTVVPLYQKERPQRKKMWSILEVPFKWASYRPRLTLLGLFLVLGIPLWLLPAQIEVSEEASQPVRRLAQLYNKTLGHPEVYPVLKKVSPFVGGVLRPFFQHVEFGRQWQFSRRQEVYVSLWLPPGSPIDQADSLIARFERIALSYPIVRQTMTQITDRSAFLRVQFTDEALKTIEPLVVREKLIQQAIHLAGLTVSVGGIIPEGYYSGVGGQVSGFIVEARGPNYEKLEALANAFAQQILRHPRVVKVDTEVDRYGRAFQREWLQFRWTAPAVLRTSVYPQQLMAAVDPMLYRYYAGLQADLEDQIRVPIRIITEEAEGADVYQLMEKPIALQESLKVKLGIFSTFRRVQLPPAIERINQQYRRYISIDYRGPWRLGNKLVNKELEAFATPPGYQLTRRKFNLFDKETTRSYAGILVLAIFLVSLITAAVFESWRLPLLVMLSVPLALIGVALGFLWTEVNFAEGAIIGSLLLAGIAVNDSILLVDRYRQLQWAHPTMNPAWLIRLAVRDRLRPMWTTTLTSVVALLPLLLWPESNDFWTGLAVTVTGGLLASTLLAPVATVAWVSLKGFTGRDRKRGL